MPQEGGRQVSIGRRSSPQAEDRIEYKLSQHHTGEKDRRAPRTVEKERLGYRGVTTREI